MKKENVYLILFFIGIAIAAGYVIKLIREMNKAIKISKE